MIFDNVKKLDKFTTLFSISFNILLLRWIISHNYFSTNPLTFLFSSFSLKQMSFYTICSTLINLHLPIFKLRIRNLKNYIVESINVFSLSSKKTDKNHAPQNAMKKLGKLDVRIKKKQL